MAAAGMGVGGVDQLVDSLAAAAKALAGLDHDEAGQLLAARVAQTAPRATGLMASRVDSEGGTVVIATRYAVYVNARTGWATKALQSSTEDILSSIADDVADVVATIRGD